MCKTMRTPRIKKQNDQIEIDSTENVIIPNKRLSYVSPNKYYEDLITLAREINERPLQIEPT